MNIQPWNRRLLIELPREEEQSDSSILLPEDYKPSPNDHLIGKVLATASDATKELVGKKVVIPPISIEEIQIDDVTHYLILENYIVAVLD